MSFIILHGSEYIECLLSGILIDTNRQKSSVLRSLWKHLVKQDSVTYYFLKPILGLKCIVILREGDTMLDFCPVRTWNPRRWNHWPGWRNALAQISFLLTWEGNFPFKCGLGTELGVKKGTLSPNQVGNHLLQSLAHGRALEGWCDGLVFLVQSPGTSWVRHVEVLSSCYILSCPLIFIGYSIIFTSIV